MWNICTTLAKRDDSDLYLTEKRYIRKDNSILWGASSEVTTLRDQQGSLRYFAAQIEDITEGKRIKEALKESEERFRHAK